ncbi:MAG: hypothetical protein F9K16_12020 [Thermoanaerobaculia bacterium]|jgi:hypothetical protein|nr:MAG: hypothetical protein F9K16_12020 [Thermoanaerobaculia bacterium]MBZ0103263.1 hypothetical protein [Thermoanaerobaculia bacterium]
MSLAIRFACLLAAAVAPAAAAGWLPAGAEEATARQLAGRLVEAGLAPGETPEVLSASREMVAHMIATIERWKVAGTRERAPEFPGLELPPAGEPHLDAMARYQVCTMALMIQHGDSAFDDDLNARLTASLGLTALTLAVVRLREPFVRQGGTDAQIEAALTSAAHEKILTGIQEDPAVRAHVEKQCTPVTVALLSDAIGRMADDGSPGEP